MNTQLKAARLACNWTQEQVADKLDVSLWAVARWESGASHPKPYNQKLLCKLFGKTPEELGFT